MSLSASSSLTADTGASEGLLTSARSWSAETNSTDQYLQVRMLYMYFVSCLIFIRHSLRHRLQVSLDEPSLVSSVTTSGRGDAQEWVTEFTLSHSVDGETFTFIENPIDHYRA